MTWQLSKLMIAMFLVSGLVGGLSLVISHAADVFGLSAYDETDLEAYQQLEALNENALQVRTDATDIQNPESALDQIGYLVVGAYNAVKVALGSYNIVLVMLDAALNGIDLGPFGAILKQMLSGIMLAIVFFGIIFYLIFKVFT